MVAAASISLALVVGSVVSTWMAVRAAQAERLSERRFTAEKQARRDAERSKERALQAERARAIELARALAAERQTGIERDRAEANFEQARKAVNEYFVQVSQSQSLKVPGMEHLRQELLRSALAFYEDFVRQRGDDPALKLELAHTQYRIGLIRLDAADDAGGREAFVEASRRYQRLIRANPDDLPAQAGWALVVRELVCPAAARTSANVRPPASAGLINLCRPW